jgi:hypothetical protein
MSKKLYSELDSIECPKCGSECDLSDEPAYYTDGESNPANCSECDEEFYVHARCSWTFEVVEE